MQIIKYYQSQNQEHWKNEIGKGDWSAAKLLYSWLNTDKLKQVCGESTEIFLLTDGDNLASFAILAEQDEIVARKGASVAGDARKKIESKTGKPVLTGRNAKSLKKITK